MLYTTSMPFFLQASTNDVCSSTPVCSATWTAATRPLILPCLLRVASIVPSGAAESSGWASGKKAYGHRLASSRIRSAVAVKKITGYSCLLMMGATARFMCVPHGGRMKSTLS